MVFPRGLLHADLLSGLVPVTAFLRLSMEVHVRVKTSQSLCAVKKSERGMSHKAGNTVCFNKNVKM